MVDNEELLKPTHEFVAQRLKELAGNEVVDVEKLEPFAHSILGCTLYVGPMGYEEHKKYHNIRRFEDIKHVNAGKGDEDPKDRTLSDKQLLSKAVYTGDGKPLGDEQATTLLTINGSGPENFQLISMAARANPPREFLVIEVAQLMNARSVDAVLWRLLIDGGLVKVLIDYMSSHATPEEKAWAERELVKAEEVALAFEVMFEAEDTARAMGITFKSALELVADAGTGQAAIAQQMKNAEERAHDEAFQET